MKQLCIWIVITLAVTLAGCKEKPSNPKDQAKPKVALVLAVGGLGDRSVNDSAYAGLREASKSLNVEATYVEPQKATEFADHLRRFARDNASIIFGIGYSMQEPIEQVAKEFPKTTFAIVDVPASGPNVISLVFRENEGAFLAGALAAMMSKNKHVGFIGGMDIPLLRKWQAGFEAGAKYIDQAIKTEARFLDSTVKGFSDPVRGKEMATAMYNAGCDVLLQVTGGSGRGVFLAAKETGRFAIGSDQNQDAEAPGVVLTSVMRRLEPLIVAAVREQLHDGVSGGQRTFGLKEGGIALTDFAYTRQVIGEEKIERLKELRDQIISGKINAPTNP